MLRLPDELLHLYGEDWTGPKLEEAMRQYHPDIAKLFGSGIGLHLMWLESRILIKSLLILAEQSVPALGMHDGLMVGSSKEGIAKAAMEAASGELLGEQLTVISKPVVHNLAPRSITSP